MDLDAIMAAAEAEMADVKYVPPKISNEMVVDHALGVTSSLVFDDGEGKFHLAMEHDAEPLIDENKAFYNEAVDRKCEFRRVASFPMHMGEFFKRIYGADPFARGNEKLLQRVLNDPDLRHFRTSPGRIAIRA